MNNIIKKLNKFKSLKTTSWNLCGAYTVETLLIFILKELQNINKILKEKK